MKVIPGGCSLGPGSHFEKSVGVSIDECNSKCLGKKKCVMHQRSISGGGTCYFYDQLDTDGPNGEADKDWQCGVKQCQTGTQLKMICQ